MRAETFAIVARVLLELDLAVEGWGDIVRILRDPYHKLVPLPWILDSYEQ